MESNISNESAREAQDTQAVKESQRQKITKLLSPLRSYSKISRAVLLMLLYGVRGFLKLCMYMYKYVWCPHPYAIANDYRAVYDGIAVKRRIEYGHLDREFMDCIVPVPHRQQNHPGFFGTVKEIVTNTGGGHIQVHAAKRNVIVFFHGGGWVIEGSDVQLQQLTSWVREGFTVYSVNYPLSPEHRFPIAIVSFLKALRTLKEKHGVESVHIVGESAGANIAALGVGILKNPKLMESFVDGTSHQFHTWDFPQLLSYSCWYGVLDRESWRKTPGKFLGYQMGEYSIFKYGLELCFMWYESHEGILDNKVTLMEYEEYIQDYCPVQFISGGIDPIGLQASNKVAHEMLSGKGLKSEHVLMEELTHGGVAYPPQIQKWLFGIDIEKTCVLANKKIMAFIKEHSCD
mmetsp:Transcript_12886/g.15620  ORF Transcript_12886/g.15620 Transcript_12886/m.15620 type:complete len:403 (+) Transcript_12886:3-1211(+)